MKIANAKALARVLLILMKLKLISYKTYDRYVDDLTVRVLRAELKED